MQCPGGGRIAWVQAAFIQVPQDILCRGVLECLAMGWVPRFQHHYRPEERSETGRKPLESCRARCFPCRR